MFNSAGNRNYTLSCLNASLDTRVVVGNLSVLSEGVQGFESAKQYDVFTLEYFNASFDYAQCGSCELDGFGNASQGVDSCLWNVSYVPTQNDVNISCVAEGVDYDAVIEIDSGNLYWDVREVLGDFYVDSYDNVIEGKHFIIFNIFEENSLIHVYDINNSGTFFNGSVVLNLVYSNLRLNTFYQKGSIFSNKSQVEIIN